MASHNAWQFSSSKRRYWEANSANHHSIGKETAGNSTRTSNHGLESKRSFTIAELTSEDFQCEGRLTSPSGGPNQPHGNLRWSTRSFGLITLMHQELTKSADQGETSAASNFRGHIIPGIMRSLRRPQDKSRICGPFANTHVNSGRFGILVAVASFFPVEAASSSESEEPG